MWSLAIRGIAVILTPFSPDAVIPNCDPHQTIGVSATWRLLAAVRTDADETQLAFSTDGHPPVGEPPAPALRLGREPASGSTPAREPSADPRCRHGWPIPSAISVDPDEARACIQLPKFDAPILDLARDISDCYPAAEAEYRKARGKAAAAGEGEIPHFERVFRIAVALSGVGRVAEAGDDDDLVVLTAWHCVRPGVAGYLGSYPKSLLCPLFHAARPVALDSLPPAKRIVFGRRAPVYLRYLLCEKFGLRTCADIENADLRHLLRSAGFRLIRPSAVPEIVFAGITRGEDPPVRPWKLTLRQELSDARAAEMLIDAAVWQIKYGLRLVTVEQGQPRWNIGRLERLDWEDVFLSLGVRVAPSLTRESGLLNWRAVLAQCVDRIGAGNLPPELLARVTAHPQRVCHDSHQAIWDVLDRAARTVLDRVRVSEPQLFARTGGMNYETARTFRRWARLFDEVSPNILSRFGVSAFTALHRVAPEYFGWGCRHLKPWEVEQEHGKWKGPRGRALLRSAYAFALYEAGLGTIETREKQVVWQCTLDQFSGWSVRRAEERISAYDFLYGLASRHGLSPLLTREVTHTAAISLLAGMNLHEHLPRIEGCWDVCLRTALELHGDKLEVRLALPDLVPLPLRLRKAVLTPLRYSYLHRELHLVRDFDLRMARESRRKLEEIPGWLEDERILGTPLTEQVGNPASSARAVLDLLRPEPWLEPRMRRIRFHALYLLTSKRATLRTSPGEAGLTCEEIRVLLRLALEATLEHTNIVQVSLPAIRRGFERILARDDTCNLLDSLLLHIGTAYETEVWGQVRKFIVLDVINDLLALTVRASLVHLAGSE
jgi:hypothetical protein